VHDFAASDNLSISADPLDEERINFFELWRDQESLDAWRKVAKLREGSISEKGM